MFYSGEIWLALALYMEDFGEIALRCIGLDFNPQRCGSARKGAPGFIIKLRLGQPSSSCCTQSARVKSSVTKFCRKRPVFIIYY